MTTRSRTLSTLYPEHLMLDLFGTVTPTATERAGKFFDIWMKNAHLKYQISDRNAELIWQHKFTELMKALELKSPWDYQLKGTEVRFNRAEDLAQFKLAWSI